MNARDRHPLLDPPALTAARLAALEDQAAQVLETSNDVLLFGAEAELPLEGITASMGGPSVDWLNVITSPYGRMFGDLLRSRGTTVHDVVAPNDRPVRVAEVAEALERWPEVGAVAVVHAESVIGTVNPLAEIVDLVAAHGALTVVDAVASAGAEPLPVDALGLDVCVVGPQKGWGGPAGVSVASVSERAWAMMRASSVSARRSVLSLLDIKEFWIDAGRRRIRGTPAALEILALEAALDRLQAEGMDAVIGRHVQAAAAARAGVQALGLSLWVADERDACAVATPVRTPEGIDSDIVVELAAKRYGVFLMRGTGDLAGSAVRLDHMGSAATPAYVLSAVAAIGGVLVELGAEVDVAAGTGAAAAAFAALTSLPTVG